MCTAPGRCDSRYSLSSSTSRTWAPASIRLWASLRRISLGIVASRGQMLRPRASGCQSRLPSSDASSSVSTRPLIVRLSDQIRAARSSSKKLLFGHHCALDVVAAAEVAIIRAKQHHRRRQRISSLEMDLDGCTARGTGGVCPTSSSEGTEDADYVVGAPGPEGPPADLDPVAIRPDAQARRAGDLAVVVEANPAPPVQLVDLPRDLFGGAAQIGGKFFDTHRRARSEQPPEGGSPYLPGHHFSWLTHVSDFFVRQHSS